MFLKSISLSFLYTDLTENAEKSCYFNGFIRAQSVRVTPALPGTVRTPRMIVLCGAGDRCAPGASVRDVRVPKSLQETVSKIMYYYDATDRLSLY
jgi:hypothetical protein